jgi:hypothetical protein
MEDTFNTIQQDILLMEMEAKEKASAARAGANIAMNQAGQVREAGQWGAVGTVLSSAKFFA